MARPKSSGAQIVGGLALVSSGIGYFANDWLSGCAPIWGVPVKAWEYALFGAMWLAAALLWLRGRFVESHALCPSCGKRVPVTFMVHVTTVNNATLNADFEACKHCLDGLPYP